MGVWGVGRRAGRLAGLAPAAAGPAGWLAGGHPFIGRWSALHPHLPVAHTCAHTRTRAPPPPHPPQIAGVDLDEMLRGALGGKLDLSEPLVDYETPSGDLVQIWLE